MTKKMTVLDFHTGRGTSFTGTEEDFRRALRKAYPEVRQFPTLDQMVEFLNNEGWVEVHVEQVVDHNLLPEGYWYKTQLDYDEPWVRESHFHDEENAPDTDTDSVQLGRKLP